MGRTRRCRAPGRSLSPCVPSCVGGLRSLGSTQHPGEKLCLQHCPPHTSRHGFPPRGLHVCHPLCTPNPLAPGEGWTLHSHAAPWARRGAEEPPPRHRLQPSAAASAHHHPSLSQARAASGTCPGGIEPLGTPKALELGLCGTREPLTAPGTPLGSFGVSAIARGHIQPPKHSPECRAPLRPGCGAAVGRGRSRSVPPRPRRRLLAGARATPSQATSARSLGVPRAPHGPSASSLAWQSGFGLEPRPEGSQSPAAERGAGCWHCRHHPHGPGHGPQPWGGVSGLRGDTRRVFCSTSSIASGSRAWGVGVQGRG